ARRRHLHRAVGRARQPLSTIRRTRDRARAPRRPPRARAAIGVGDRPRQRLAAQAAVLTVRRRRDRRHGQPPRGVSHSPQRPFSARHRVDGLADAADRMPARRGRCHGAGVPWRAAAGARRLLRSDRHGRSRLAYRDVASATNRLTLISAVLPPGCVTTHTVYCLGTPLPPRAQHFLCGLFNSFVVNYLVRLRVTTHVTTATVEQLPIPTAEAAPAAFREIAALARLMSHGPNAAAFARLNSL